MAFSAQVAISILSHESGSDGLSQFMRATPVSHAFSLTDGVGAGQAQIVWSDSRTLASGQIEDLDFSALQDDRGQVEITEVVAIYIKNTHSEGRLYVGEGWTGGGPTLTPVSWAPTTLDGGVKLRPGAALFLQLAGEGYVTSSQKKMRFSADDGTAVSYDIVVIGKGSVA